MSRLQIYAQDKKDMGAGKSPLLPFQLVRGKILCVYTCPARICVCVSFCTIIPYL